YGAFNAGHGGPDLNDPHHVPYLGQSGMATWRRDGFVSLTNAARPTSGDPGWVTTKPLVFKGSTLDVNAVVHKGGSLRVEALDAQTGQPIPGYTVDQSIPVAG